ncbi:MAG TPA: hypothetical protein VD994_07705, partial [Prosthecobacter sp.]|nr:hypothetical protein [Prosthecobacter sp.]
SAAAQQGLRALTGVDDATIQETAAPADGYLMLGEVNAAHPLLRPFADARLRDFTKLRFWKHRRLVLGAQAAKQMQILAKFDNGDPAIVACPVGKGTVILLASGWHPADSQLALSTKFVPLLYGWLEAAGFQREETTSLQVGEVLPVSAGGTVTTPAKETLSVRAGTPVMATMPGFYSVTEPGAAKPVIYAVNLAPEESRITPMEPGQLRELGPRLDSAEAKGRREGLVERERLAASEEEMRQRAWVWILAGLLCVLAAETWLAGRIKTRGEVLTPGT